MSLCFFYHPTSLSHLYTLSLHDALPISIDDTSYEVYWGCKPKDCISESYTVAYDPKKKEMVAGAFVRNTISRSEEHTSELQSRGHLVCRLLLEKKKTQPHKQNIYTYYPT